MQTQNSIDHTKINPALNYRQAQIEILDEVEQQFESEPDKTHLLIVIGLSLIEGGVSYMLLASAPLVIAITASFFPVFLLWAMANYEADNDGIPEKYDQLVEVYNDKLNQ